MIFAFFDRPESVVAPGNAAARTSASADGGDPCADMVLGVIPALYRTKAPAMHLLFDDTALPLA
jgi:hypothetical protein